jgi:hypothetical protein
MQQGSPIRSAFKCGPDVWQFRWADRGPLRKAHLSQAGDRNSLPIRRRGLCLQNSDGLLREIDANVFQRCHLPMTIAEVCDHFVQRELTKDNSREAIPQRKRSPAGTVKGLVQAKIPSRAEQSVTTTVARHGLSTSRIRAWPPQIELFLAPL